MSILSKIQQTLESLHDVSTELDVRAYVVDDETRQSIPGARDDIPEQLFVRQEADAMELALYLDPQVLAHLEHHDPHEHLHRGNLNSYCVALEGVSHFVFLAYRAQAGRPVSALELEIQAEVDKFVTAWLLLGEQGVAMQRSGRVLRRDLFKRYTVHEAVPPEEHARYHTATRAADKYCGHLIQRFAKRADKPGLTRAVRSYYRRGLAEKLRAA